MVKITIIGYGNVAQHLIHAFQQQSDVVIEQVYSRNYEDGNRIDSSLNFTSNWDDLVPTDLFIIAVSDDAIAEVSLHFPLKNQLVVHTSGSVSLEQISNHNRRGVFYPLQTFTKGKNVDFSQIPICIETEFSADLEILKKLAQVISEKTHIINSQQRRALHVAAVYVNNFVNHLYQIGNEICIENQIPFSILQSLIKETASKIETLSPVEAQTGPAKRNDQQTIESHLDFLEPNKMQRNIYKLLTESIQSNGKEL
ncbi:DUF2520 domain-containing protein [Flavobacterium antarcticum]|uniref:Rossmann-like and DUF2520 domain-containing protein n=1 Tax=Flavobacterium antarcticum TaxID=271155 RepID=UPI0003B68146|nr:DUF2520 domain-containing protein [Flavobacterium antarcticum]